MRQNNSKLIERLLDQLYPSPPIPLQHQDAYTLLIAVLLSAQCTDVRVNKITPQLFAKAKTPWDMIKLTPKQIESIIRPCGLAPRKSQAIFDLSVILLNRYQGRVPASFEQLEELPGVGHKTASVVMSQAFNTPAFPVDTHIHRLAKRWGLSSGANVIQTEKDLKEIFPAESWNKLHLQMIYYAREHCPARKCYGLECQMCKQLFPKRKEKVANPR